MKIPRWLSVVAVLSSTALLFGCGLTGSGSSSSSGGGLAITTAALPDATVSQSYSGTLQASGGTSPYSWSVTSGSLPTGLNMSTSGQVTGTPTSMGSYSFQVQVTDASKQSSSGSISIKVTGPPPGISSISPSYGSSSGGTSVTISGKNLQSGATITFGGVAGTSVNVVNSGQMTAVTPPHATGSVDVTITNPGGRSATLAAGFGYGSAAPSVSAVSPNSGSTSGGTTVAITGSNFVVGALVFFGAVAATGVNVTSATQIQATTPSVSTAAAVDVVVKNSDGQSGSLTNGFTYTDPPPDSAPSVSSVSPNTTSAGTDVAVNGTSFGSGATVDIGSTAASDVKFISSTQLTVTVPNVSPGTYDVTVKNSNGLSATLSSGLTVDTPQSLLSGCTVNASNQPVCGSNVGSAAIPSGWTLVTAQGFESGSVPSSQQVYGNVVSGFAHTGNYAAMSTYKGDGYAAAWILNSGVLNATEFYASWWEYDESQGRFNDEMFLMRPYLNNSSGGLEQEDIIDWFGYGTTSHSGFNSPDAVLVIEPQTNAVGGVTNVNWQHGGHPNWGTWTQFEVHYKANDPGSTNGDIEVFENGQLIDQWTNQNLNGTLDMTNMALEIGGVYTKLTWWNESGTFSPPSSCTNYIGQGQDNGPRVTDFSKPCPCANECPPNGYVPVFKRYFDDIVVLKK